MTAQDLCDRALLLLAVYDPGGTPSTSERADAFNLLNELIGSWNIGGLALYYMKRETLSLTGAASYTIATGATFNTPRPIRVITATVVSGNASKELEICTAARWAAVTKDRSRAGKFGRYLFYDAAYPTGTIHINPTPATGGTLELYSLKELAQISAIADAIDFPPGYYRALRFALAVDYGSAFGLPVPESVAAGASEAKGMILAANQSLLGTPAAAPQ